MSQLFKILHESALNVCSEFGQLQQQEIEKQAYQEANQEMEAQVERLECELARLKAYETSFHDV